MKIGLVSDPHANVAGLHEALAALRQQRVELVICAGDAVGYGDDAEAVVTLLRHDVDHTVLGNHDAMATGVLSTSPERWQALRLEASARQLSPSSSAWLAALPARLDLEIDGSRVVVAHGSPWDPLGEYVHRDYSDFQRFASLGADYVVLGHTHRQMLVRIASTTIVNPGSCGQPRDGSGGASWAVVDTTDGAVTFGVARYDPPGARTPGGADLRT